MIDYDKISTDLFAILSEDILDGFAVIISIDADGSLSWKKITEHDFYKEVPE